MLDVNIDWNTRSSEARDGAWRMISGIVNLPFEKRIKGVGLADNNFKLVVRTEIEITTADNIAAGASISAFRADHEYGENGCYINSVEAKKFGDELQVEILGLLKGNTYTIHGFNITLMIPDDLVTKVAGVAVQSIE